MDEPFYSQLCLLNMQYEVVSLNRTDSSSQIVLEAHSILLDYVVIKLFFLLLGCACKWPDNSE